MKFHVVNTTLLLCLLFTPRVFALRIVSLKPNITMTLMSLGESENIVGITKFCPRPNPGVEVIADYTSIQTERVVRLKPDVVLSSRENSQSRQYELLVNAGFRIVLLDFQTLSDVRTSVGRLGEILERQDRAQTLLSEMAQDINQIKKTTHAWRNKTFSVIVQRQPLMIAAGQTFVSTLFENIGLKNTFSANKITYPVLDGEALLRKNPDIIFDMSHDGGGRDFSGRKVIAIDIQDFLAAPQSIAALRKLVDHHAGKSLLE